MCVDSGGRILHACVCVCLFSAPCCSPRLSVHQEPSCVQQSPAACPSPAARLIHPHTLRAARGANTQRPAEKHRGGLVHMGVKKLQRSARTKMSAAEKINPFLSAAMRCVQHQRPCQRNGAKHAPSVKFVMTWCNTSVYNGPRGDFRTKAELYSRNISPLIALTSLSLPASR